MGSLSSRRIRGEVKPWNAEVTQRKMVLQTAIASFKFFTDSIAEAAPVDKKPIVPANLETFHMVNVHVQGDRKCQAPFGLNKVARRKAALIKKDDNDMLNTTPTDPNHPHQELNHVLEWTEDDGEIRPVLLSHPGTLVVTINPRVEHTRTLIVYNTGKHRKFRFFLVCCMLSCHVLCWFKNCLQKE